MNRQIERENEARERKSKKTRVSEKGGKIDKRQREGVEERDG